MATDLQLFNRLKKSDVSSFEELFNRYYSNLCYFAECILNDVDSAEDIVQDFFSYVWSKRKTIKITSSVKSYFYISIRNRTFNFIRQSNSRISFQNLYKKEFSEEITISDFHLEYSLKKSINSCIDQMPERQRQIFKLSKLEGKKNAEIANLLQISIKTVEANITKAYNDLRVALNDFQELIITFSLFYSNK